MKRDEIYASVTASVVRQIEEGAPTWRMPWAAIAEGSQPVNVVTHKGYRGGNWVTFGMVAAVNGWSGTWATYKQWQSLGAQVRRGEKSTWGVKWSPVDDRATGERRLVPFVFNVFAAEQVDGWEAPAREARDTPEKVGGAEQFFARIGADVRHGGNQAFYRPSDDSITLPNIDQFRAAVDYYATRAHESAHWTGHASRLARDLAGRFGTDSYAMEELTAELSAAFTCSVLGISTTPRPDHAAYLTSWLKVLRSDASALFTVASKAQQATDFLAGLGGLLDIDEQLEVAA